MLVSIIIPAYNVEKYVERCLNSVVNQTYSDIEILVINDASQDNTLNIVTDFAEKDTRIKIINQLKNRGNGVGRNSAILKACGEFILFVDSDDYIELNAVEQLICFQRETSANVIVFGHEEHSSISIIKLKKKFLPSISENESHDEIYKSFLIQQKGLYIQPWKYFIEKNMLINNNIFFDESGNYFEDIIFSAKLIYYSKRINLFPHTLYHYVRRKGSITNIKTKKTIESRISALMSVKCFLKDINAFDDYKDAYILFFMRTGLIQSFYDCVNLKKRNYEIEDFLFELSQTLFVKNFNISQLDLPVINKKKNCPEISYGNTQRMAFLLKNYFSFTLLYFRFLFFFQRIL